MMKRILGLDLVFQDFYIRKIKIQTRKIQRTCRIDLFLKTVKLYNKYLTFLKGNSLCLLRMGKIDCLILRQNKDIPLL